MIKQTAIQLLRESIDSEIKLGTKMVINWDMYLEMESEQIIDAYYQCGRDNFEHLKVINRSATEYYNQTYKGGEQ